MPFFSDCQEVQVLVLPSFCREVKANCSVPPCTEKGEQERRPDNYISVLIASLPRAGICHHLAVPRWTRLYFPVFSSTLTAQSSPPGKAFRDSKWARTGSRDRAVSRRDTQPSRNIYSCLISPREQRSLTPSFPSQSSAFAKETGKKK